MSEIDKITLNDIYNMGNWLAGSIELLKQNIPVIDIATAISSQSTDEEVPSAKCVYDMIGDVESLLEAI